MARPAESTGERRNNKKEWKEGGQRASTTSVTKVPQTDQCKKAPEEVRKREKMQRDVGHQARDGGGGNQNAAGWPELHRGGGGKTNTEIPDTTKSVGGRRYEGGRSREKKRPGGERGGRHETRGPNRCMVRCRAEREKLRKKHTAARGGRGVIAETQNKHPEGGGRRGRPSRFDRLRRELEGSGAGAHSPPTGGLLGRGPGGAATSGASSTWPHV